MNIVKLNGEDTELYRRVAHLVMNREVLASNNNYPFKTSSEHIWFVACDDEGRTLGFIPVVLRNRKATINNYYAAEDDEEVLCLMLTQKRLRYHIRHPEQTHPGLQALRVFGNVRMGKIRENDIQRR